MEGGGSVTTPPTFLGMNTFGLAASQGLNPDDSFNGINLYTFSVGWGTGQSGGELHAFLTSSIPEPTSLTFLQFGSAALFRRKQQPIH